MPANSGFFSPHATWGTTGGDICISLVTCYATDEEEPGVAGSTFDGGWGTRWWQDVDAGAENEEGAVGVGVEEDGKVGVHGDVTVDWSGSGMLNGGWNFSWDDHGVSDEEDAEVGEVMNLVGLADGIWSKVVLSGEENIWRKGSDAVNVRNFGGAVGKLSNKFWHFGLKIIVSAVADSDWDEDYWESVWTERRFDLGKEDGGGNPINDVCDKYDDDNCDDCVDDTSCNISIINVENLMFSFSIRWR